ncbi:F0F1 ATP synthase subunit B [Patescibacteria group bacterium]|nr:F0F1 ATP synthase subunit B [Patescibacteria group bacterium]MBU2159048.1 F0F1 ATP synthase subunit B [Patescibacteria group bacterium]MBU2220697.1 F0F1 ATP synthase subunit B [Patescibacteria group bacterium]
MEQLFEAFGIDGKLLLAQLINFGVLFVALTWLLYKPVMKTLDERRAKIAQGVEDAEQASQKLAAADENAAQVVHGAETEAEGIVASARELAGTEKSRIVKEAEARAAQVAADAEARAQETAAQALRDSEKEVARLAVLAAEKVLRKS